MKRQHGCTVLVEASPREDFAARITQGRFFIDLPAHTLRTTADALHDLADTLAAT